MYFQDSASFSGDRYFLSIVDDYSRAVWVYLMRAKSEVSHFLTMFCNMASTQFGEKVKRIRTDNGMEFQSNYMLSFYKEHGILLETSCTYTPEQNGVVERKHRHILEIARALRFEASLPIDFWGECVMTSVYIINRLPSQVIGNKSPHEILLGRSPTYSHLRVFGCLTYAHDNHCKYDKFGERGRPCVFVGYPMGQKGYKVYDLQNQKLYVTRNAIFFEDIFPFANNFEDLNLNGEKDLDVALRRIKSNIPTWREPGQTMRHDDDDDDASSHAVHDITPATETGQHENPYENPEVGQHDLQITDAAQAAEPCTHEQSATRQTEQTRAPNVYPADIPRKSDRIKMKPKRLEGFETNLPHSIDYPSHTPMPDPGTSTVYPLSHFVSYDKFSQSHKVFLAAITSRDEPKHFAQAVKDPLWCDAMKREIQALEQNGTWSLVSLPPGKKVVDSKWVYKIKYKPNGEIERHKARLVAKGYTQIEGIDFHETFAPVAKLVTVRCMLAVAAKKRWEVHQLDVNNAFLHGDLKEDIYMRVPQGFSKAGDTRVCKLQKSLYGLRQASRNWYQKFTASLITLGFRQSRADHSLFVFQRGTTYVSALIYVDDVLLAGNDKQRIQDVKTHLDSQFSIKDLGPLKYFLGIEVVKSAEGFVLSQRKYTLDILEECGLQGSRPTSFPMEQNLKLRKDDTSPAVDAARYRRLVGRLLYLTVTRPDIVYSVNQLSQFLSNPRQSHMDATMRVLRYLKMTPGQGIFLPTKGELTLNAYSDADWGGCAFSRRSSTGYFISLGGSPISWRTKKQTVVSRSSAEAEYRAMATTVSEVLWLRWLLKDFLASQTGPTSLFCDNQAARQIANNPVFHERTKHVEMDCYFVRERVESGEITPCCISTNLQVADIFTKALGSERFRFLRDKLGVRDLHTPS